MQRGLPDDSGPGRGTCDVLHTAQSSPAAGQAGGRNGGKETTEGYLQKSMRRSCWLRLQRCGEGGRIYFEGGAKRVCSQLDIAGEERGKGQRLG